MASEVQSVINYAGLATLLPRFISERVYVNVILAASDQDLIRLGISTIGDRCRLRVACRRRRYYNNNLTSTSIASMSSSRSITTPVFSSNSQTQNIVNNFPNNSNSSSSFFEQVREERFLLFAPRKARGSCRTTSTTDTGRSVLSSCKKPASKT